MPHKYIATMLMLCVLATSHSAQAEIITIDVTVKAIDPKGRTITVTKTTKTKSKDIDLEIGKKAKILAGGKDAAIDSVKPGMKVSVSYETELEVVTKIESSGDGDTPSQDAKTSESGEVLNLEELNTPQMDVAPWVSPDGLEIFWAAGHSDKEMSVWTARRDKPDAFFGDKKRLFTGHSPVLSSDGLELLFRGSDAETISLATRKGRDGEFGRPRSMPGLSFPGHDPAPRWLTEDGLTLYLDLRPEKGGRHYCWEIKRETQKSNWKRASKTEAKFDGMPSKFRFTQVSATSDNRNLFCSVEFSEGNQLVYRAGVLSRKAATGPFTEWTEIPLKGPNDGYPLCLRPQFVESTHELFFGSNAFYSAPQAISKRGFDLWVVKDFLPPIEMPEQGKSEQ